MKPVRQDDREHARKAHMPYIVEELAAHQKRLAVSPLIAEPLEVLVLACINVVVPAQGL